MNMSKKSCSNYTKPTVSKAIHQSIDNNNVISKKYSNKNTSIFLIGMMGAGKSTVGRCLAQYIGKKFVDLDSEIEIACGVNIPVIFEIEGEDGFRKRETDILQKISLEKNIVLATGGGAVLAEDNRHLLTSGGIVVYLQANIDVLFKRVSVDQNRPLLAIKDPYVKIKELLEIRDPIYHEIADIVIDTSSYNAADIAKELCLILQKI
ncbi:shikimate kinase [Candidatus Kinetoplastibacterium desouzaii TCC079E]|uniref:Shikimate kinase n=1 Tax=Candidatus Kinetoplastidibacterium desouzai TCC079E TaxID=1208919 RepID=M1M515_9PROT|nr:shikimate kinase [Candidatus Kinetoplastibacterium desouzaii]AGF47250.1 shikimate kinase [Candidatus Kinetoplastibacterium desouzaii TCC079E]